MRSGLTCHVLDLPALEREPKHVGVRRCAAVRGEPYSLARIADREDVFDVPVPLGQRPLGPVHRDMEQVPTALLAVAQPDEASVGEPARDIEDIDPSMRVRCVVLNCAVLGCVVLDGGGLNCGSLFVDEGLGFSCVQIVKDHIEGALDSVLDLVDDLAFGVGLPSDAHDEPICRIVDAKRYVLNHPGGDVDDFQFDVGVRLPGFGITHVLDPLCG